MKVEPVYNDLNGAPMKFHKFLCVMVWIGIIRSLAEFFTTVGDFQGINVYLVVWILLACANIVCIFIAGVDLPSRKWLGVKAYFASFGVSIATYVFNFIFSAVYGLDLYEPTLQLVSIVIVSCVFVIPIYIYYGKRRNLFEPRVELFYSSEKSNGECTAEDVVEDEAAIEEGKEENVLPNNIPIIKKEDNIISQEEMVSHNCNNDNTDVISDIYDEQLDKEIEEELIVQNDNVDMQKEPEFDGVRFCFKCGHEIGPEALFCEKCGTRIR